MSQNDCAGQRCHHAVDTVTIEAKRGRRNRGDRHRRMACQGDRHSPVPFRLTRIVMPASSPLPS
jgi:hypothetical protein